MKEEKEPLRLRFFAGEFAVCQLRDASGVDFTQEFVFLSQTPDELSLVCAADAVPATAIQVESGWSLFRVEGVLDFGLVGILSRLSSVLAAAGISLFAVSTFATDYLLVKTRDLPAAQGALRASGYVLL